MTSLYFDRQSVEIVEVSDEGHFASLPEDALPLGKLLIAKEFPFQYGDFPHTPVHEWEEAKTQKLGSLVIEELAALDPPANFTRDTVTRLNILGVFPPRAYFDKYKHFGGFSNFKQQLGIEKYAAVSSINRYTEYGQLTATDLAELLVERYNEFVEFPPEHRFEGPLNHRMVTAMTQAGLSPGHYYIERRFGGLSALNESLGYPDTKLWDRLDFIAYGAAVLRHNVPEEINDRNLRLLSKYGLGPHPQAIRERFSSAEFWQLAHEELQRQLIDEQQHREAVLNYYSQYMPPERQQDEFADKAMHRAVFLLVSHFYPGRTPELPDQLKPTTVRTILNDIINRQPNVTLADIETIAITLDVFDDIWPIEQTHYRPPVIANCPQPSPSKRHYGQRRLY